jgi:hypothetical protein
LTVSPSTHVSVVSPLALSGVLPLDDDDESLSEPHALANSDRAAIAAVANTSRRLVDINVLPSIPNGVLGCGEI